MSDQSRKAEAHYMIETQLSLIEFSVNRTLNDLLTRALDEVGDFVDSPIGFFHFVEPDQETISLQAWSTRTMEEFCRAKGKDRHYCIDPAGVWIDCLRERRPVIHNDYAALPHKKGIPEGHADIIRELVVPVFRDGNVVAILGVGNKPAFYTRKDVKIVSFLADLIWEIVSRKRAEEALQRSNDMLQAAADITDKKNFEQERLSGLDYFESMDRINRAIQGANDLKQMMSNVLDTMLSIFDCDRAWLVYPCDPNAASWQVPMERTKPEYPGANVLGLEVPMDSGVGEAHKIALASDGPVKYGPGTENPVPLEDSKRFGYKCFISTAIYPKTGSPWLLGMHQCSYARQWTAREEKLFQEAGRRMADGLTSMLMYRDLQESENFLNSIVENIPDMIFVKDAKTLKFVRFNRAGEQLLGYSRDELLGKNDYDFFPKDAADFFKAKDQDVLNAKALLDIPEEKILTRRNSKRILHTKKIPILDSTGQPQYLLGISEDITDRRRKDDSIRKLSHAIAQSPVSIVITDASGTIEFVNRKFTEITGFSQAEALGHNPRILKSGETSREDYEQLWETISSGEVWKGEFHNRKKSGELFWEYATIAPIRDPDGTITHYVGIKEDITERKALEEQFRQAQKMESVGRLAGGVAHDFNNLLSVIMGNVEMALEMANQDRQITAHLQGIQRAAASSADLTRQLLAFARKQAIAPRTLDLNKTVGGMLKMLRRLIGEDIDLLWQPFENVWPVKMDPSQIDQILANLCINARDAIEGTGKITIETGAIAMDEAYCAAHAGFVPGEFSILAISDNGSGMDKETIDKIFEPFFTTKELGKGTGLGLATVYGIVKQNNCFINVYSERGQGTIFKIYMPRCESAIDRAPQKPESLSMAHGSETILVVEDEEIVLNLANEILSRLGYRVLSAISPKEAIRAAKKYGDVIHLLITDVVLPGMNGPDLSDTIRAIHPEIASLFMSGYSENTIGHHYMLEDGINFIQKPFTAKIFSEKVREVIEKG